MTNAISAHKDELEKLLENLSGDRVVSGITFLALVNAYITRLDTNCSDICARVTPPAAQIDSELTYGTNIDSKLRALLRTTQNFKTAHRLFPNISRCGPQTSAGCLPATAARQTLQASSALPGQWPLSDVNQQVNARMQLKRFLASPEVEARVTNGSVPDNLRGKPKYLFRGTVK